MTEDPAQSETEDLSYEAWLAYRKAGKQRTGEKGAARPSYKTPGKKSKSKQVGRRKNGFNRRTGERNRCYRCGSEYHLLPKCPVKQESKAPAPPSVSPSRPRASFSSISLEEPPSGRNVAEQAFIPSLKVDCPIFYAKEESAVILDTGATANLVCFRWLRRQNELLVNRGIPEVTTFPALATFKVGDGRTGEVCHAADITVGVAGIKGKFTAFVSDSDIPVALGKGALETPQGCLDFARHKLTLGINGKVIPLEVSDVGHYISSVADFRKCDEIGIPLPPLPPLCFIGLRRIEKRT